MRLKRIISLFLILAFVFALSPVYAADYTYSKDFDELLKLYEEKSYYEYGKDEAIERMLRTMLENYPELFPYLADSLLKTGDKYSGYYSEEQLDSAFGDTYEGFGIVLTYAGVTPPYKYGLKIKQVYNGSPAANAGFMAGDIITNINGCSVEQLGFNTALEYLSGIQGTVLINVKRGTNESISASMERSTVTQTHFAVEQLSDSAALITIEDFNGYNLIYDFYTAVKVLSDDGVDSLIFDVRGNGGGNLDAALNMINALVPQADKRITKVILRSGEESEVFTNGIGFDFDKIAVLVDENSYSAAEFFAICIRELCGAVVVGVKTPGKAIGQSYYPLESGGVAGITEIEITSPNGTRYNGIGVSPDVVIEKGNTLQAKLTSKNPLNMFNMAQIVPGASGAAVSALQERLVNAGELNPAAVTGVYDKTTRDALRIFKILNGLGDSTRINSKVISQLNRYTSLDVSYYADTDARLEKAKTIIGVNS